jgi:hypothetical protein
MKIATLMGTHPETSRSIPKLDAACKQGLIPRGQNRTRSVSNTFKAALDGGRNILRGCDTGRIPAAVRAALPTPQPANRVAAADHLKDDANETVVRLPLSHQPGRPICRAVQCKAQPHDG